MLKKEENRGRIKWVAKNDVYTRKLRERIFFFFEGTSDFCRHTISSSWNLSTANSNFYFEIIAIVKFYIRLRVVFREKYLSAIRPYLILCVVLGFIL